MKYTLFVYVIMWDTMKYEPWTIMLNNNIYLNVFMNINCLRYFLEGTSLTWLLEGSAFRTPIRLFMYTFYGQYSLEKIIEFPFKRTCKLKLKIYFSMVYKLYQQNWKNINFKNHNIFNLFNLFNSAQNLNNLQFFL